MGDDEVGLESELEKPGAVLSRCGSWAWDSGESLVLR